MKRLEISLSTNSSETLLEQYHKYENELECFYSFIAEGIILPSKANWYDIAKRHPNIFFKSCKTN